MITRATGHVATDAPPPLHGLTASEALRRLATEGPNELAKSRPPSLARVILRVLREPMLLLLAIGGLVYLALGDRAEALLLLVFAGFSIAITVVQESRSERALEALRDMASPRALVVRDGERHRIPAREIVRGDLVVLGEGDRVTADGWVVANDGLMVDESLLTGESVPVSKGPVHDGAAGAAPRPGGEGLPFVFAGTMVVRGGGLCRIAATGSESEMGRIGRSLAVVETRSPRLVQETRRLVTLFAIGGAAMTLAAIVLYGTMRGNWLEGALAGIAIGMSLLPEEFPVVLAIFLAMGALRMSRVRVLARRASAIEALGSATVLCTDKTGTLTENRMRVVELRLPDGSVLVHDGEAALPQEFWRLAELGLLASAAQPFDPMEAAFHELGRRQDAMAGVSRRDTGWTRRQHYPLDPALLAVSHAWSTGLEPGDHVIASKGAPEAIADLCGLDEAARAKLRSSVDAMAGAGLRVLGVAEARWRGGELPGTQRDFDFCLAGLVGLEDPLRATVPDAVRQCREAGIRVAMITGDYPATAKAIARQAGVPSGAVLTGADIAGMDDAELGRRMRDVSIFARILPEQKLRIVQALKRRGEVVGMTGDGVNDAPSLKAADIGIAMGARGTDVAREAATIVLLDDEFSSIATAIRMGRRIYDNLRKAMGFIVAVHIPIAGLALFPLLFGLPILLAPVHIALLEMIIDPVCSVVFEAEPDEADIMQRPPRPAGSHLLSRGLVGWAMVQGATALAALSVILFWFGSGMAEAELRGTVFLALVGTILALVVVNRSFSASLWAAIATPNAALGIVAVLVTLLFLGAELVPPVTDLLRFEGLAALNILAALATAAGVLLSLEGLKLLARPRWRL